ncbi:MAG TPA: methyltransferase domain-containing protein [Burkholderiales bacterium]|nr:methyltransferase domain-containing protein [Burkholderiales bacterium]
MSEPSPPLDSGLARRRFAAAARSYAAASRLEAEVAARMLERLDYIKLAPRRILDAGSGPGRDLAALRRRYPRAEIVALDAAFALLPKTTLLQKLFSRPLLPVCGAIERLPFAEASFELAWSNMALHWVNEPAAALGELERALAPEGLLMFSTLGPDTLKELRAAAGARRVHEFVDMHDLGDMLVAAGFQAPVMDMEMLRVDYASGLGLLEDLRASGQVNARRDRPRGLAGRGFRARLERALGARMHSTYEVIYGHAWKRAVSAAAPTAKTIRVFKRIP